MLTLPRLRRQLGNNKNAHMCGRMPFDKLDGKSK